MDITRILENEITILTARRNEGKTQTLINMIVEYMTEYSGNVWTYGIKRPIVEKLQTSGLLINTFHSIREMEMINDGIIFADEAGKLLNVVNRKQTDEMLETLRMVSHSNNRIVLCGLPFDFKKLFSAQATCFMWKSLNIAEMINGSTIKETLQEYKEPEKGQYTLKIPKNNVLCHDEVGFWLDDITYFPEYDSKRDNQSLFQRR